MLPVILCGFVFFLTQHTLRGYWSCSLCCDVHPVTGLWSCSWSSGRKGSSLSTLWWSHWRKSPPKTLILQKSLTSSLRWIFSIKRGGAVFVLQLRCYAAFDVSRQVLEVGNTSLFIKGSLYRPSFRVISYRVAIKHSPDKVLVYYRNDNNPYCFMNSIQLSSVHVCLYSAFHHTNCCKTASQKIW